MVLVEGLAIVSLALFIWYIYTLQYSYRNCPPGPLVLPIIGNFLTLWSLRPLTLNLRDLKCWEYLDDMYKIYGDVYSITAGKFIAIVFSTYEVMTEVANLDEYSWKSVTEFSLERSYGKELGLIFVSTNAIWVEMRKFSQRTLRDFGFGKRTTMHNVISDEITQIVQDLKTSLKTSDGKIKIHTFFTLSILNVLWCMVAGKRYQHNDPKLVKIMERNLAMTKKQTFASPLMLTFPWLYRTFPRFLGTSYRLKVFEECHEFSKSLVEERRAEGFYKNDPQNYIDCFLNKIDQSKELENPVYTDEQLEIMLEDLFQTGSTTTNGTLNYAILFLMRNPGIQKKCQEEIDSVLSKKLIPTLEDIGKMPYFQATILEIHRLGGVVPNPIPRVLLKDWDFRGYHIPKGTFIVTNHYSVMMDVKYWGDPKVFRPERFINEKGEFVHDKHVVHFGVGKRNCIGFALVDSLVPIYIATLLQHFNFDVIDGEKPPTTRPEIGVSLNPLPFFTKISLRVTNNNNNGGD